MTILEKIVARRKEQYARKKTAVPFNDLYRTLDDPRPFFKTGKACTVIAECKKGSPSRGIFIQEYHPAALAREYESGGADAVSVLTEPDFFFADPAHLTNVRAQISLPVLRKDFIFDPYQIRESWALGADAVLLIASILTDTQLKELADCAAQYHLQILLEIHTRDELDRALDVPATGIGINARNLKDFSINLNASKELCALIPSDRIAVAESGIKSVQDGIMMKEAGFRGFLVGEYFVTSQDPQGTVRSFVNTVQRSTCT